MGKYSINAYKLDEVCDLLDEYDIPGNVLGKTLAGEPFVKIWKGSYERLQESDFCESDILFKIYWWPSSENYCLHVLDARYGEEIRSLWQPKCWMPNIYLFKTPQAMVDTIKILFSKKENKMEKKQMYKVVSYDIENKISNMASYNGQIDIRITADRVLTDADALIIKQKIEEVNRIDPYSVFMLAARGNGKMVTLSKYMTSMVTMDIKDVIFNDPATIVMWSDGSKTVVKANGEKFDPEKGLAMAISKRMLGNKHNYYDFFKKYIGRYEKKQKKIKE